MVEISLKMMNKISLQFKLYLYISRSDQKYNFGYNSECNHVQRMLTAFHFIGYAEDLSNLKTLIHFGLSLCKSDIAVTCQFKEKVLTQ